eukprot:9079252-Heterocapsa_arctica.AAC.1
MRGRRITQPQHTLVTDGGANSRMLSYANPLGHLPEVARPRVFRDEVAPVRQLEDGDLSGKSSQRLEVPQAPQPRAAVPHAIEPAPTSERRAGWRHDNDSRPVNPQVVPERGDLLRVRQADVADDVVVLAAGESAPNAESTDPADSSE